MPAFGTVADDYLRVFAPSHLKASTRHGYALVIKTLLIPKFGSVPLDQVDATKAREIDVDLVARGLRASTRRNVQAILRSIVRRYAVEAKLLPTAPALPRLPKVGSKIVAVLSAEQLGKIIATSCPAHRRAFLLAAHAGLRAGEIRGLRWRDVDLAAGRLVVRQAICHGKIDTPKSGHERIVPLTADLKRALEAVTSRPIDGQVSTDARGKRWSEFALGNAFRRACKRAGLEGWRFHDLRHYFVTALFRGGASAPAVQMLAGHSELTTTQRYAHMVSIDLQDAIARLGGVTGG